MKSYNSQSLREMYLNFFKDRGHKVIPSASLIPENDPTVLFTTAGMHPLVPYLLGEKHPAGNRLTDVQKCVRTGDIDDVGDERHCTFFEMLGNWSLGDYFKEEAINFSFNFLTRELGIPISMLAVTVFAGDDDCPFDDEAWNIWHNLGIPAERIAKLGKKDNWWGPAGTTGPCGPDTEMFYWTGELPAPEVFDPSNKLWVEIWNDVFMQYNKTADGTFEPLSQRNVDTGMGLLSIPLMWGLFLGAGIFINKRHKLGGRLTLAAVIAGFFAVAWFDFCLGGVIFRYTCDLTLLCALASVLLIISFNDSIYGTDGERAILEFCSNTPFHFLFALSNSS